MSNVISINVYLDRRDKFPMPFTERDAAILRGFIAWKKKNRRLMEEEATRRRPRRPRLR